MSDSKFFKAFGGMLMGLVALTVVIFLVANTIGDNSATKLSQADGEKAVAERIQPMGILSISAAAAMDTLIPAANAAADGKGTFDASCAACHGSGVAGAPKLGDKAAWKARIAQGNDTLYKHAIKGYQGKKGFMPAKGGNASLADADVKAAVDYMVAQSK
ncbi:MAG: cytochrome c5 family protein [Gammaproteobacteria bacterium]|nr:cytochrome c5 family protein [Gammaproteobacteria bacterium]